MSELRLEVGHVYVDGHGRRVRVICTDRKDGPLGLSYCVVGLIERRDKGDWEDVRLYGLNGRTIDEDGEENDWDIVREVTE